MSPDRLTIHTAADPGIDRRRFLQVMASALAAAGVAGCDPPEAIVPAVIADPETEPGTVRLYSSAVTLGGYANGVLVRHRDGRPIKVEGNPDHPASLGGTDAFAQAAILDLYDRERSAAVTFEGRIRARPELERVLVERGARHDDHGRGLRLLTGAVTSPTLRAQFAALAARYPESRRHRWESISRDNGSRGAELAFGRPLEAVPQIERAAVILAVESDLIDFAPGRLRHASDFARGRTGQGGRMNRLYALESSPSLTGAAADHRLALRPAEIEGALRALAGELGAGPSHAVAPPLEAWIGALARDLEAHRGAALLHLGPQAEPPLHAIAHAINVRLQAPVTLIEPVAGPPPGDAASLATLVADIKAGSVDTLLILGGDPVYSAPADLEFGPALKTVPLSLYLGERPDQTAAHCRWHIPETHVFEAWGDARAFDGTATIQQPQIRPLFNGRSAIELLALLLGESDPKGRDILREHWQRAHQIKDAGGFDAFWTAALRQGTVPDTSAPPVAAILRRDLFDRLPKPAPVESHTIEVLFRPDPAAWDGRFIANQWLQELPRPLTRLTWDNAALIAPATAARLGIVNEQMIELAADETRVRAPAWVLPGHAEECVTLPLGYGARIATDPIGFDAGPLRRSDALWQRAGIAVTPMAERHPLATTQNQNRMEGRDILRTATLAEFQSAKAEAPTPTPETSLYPPYPYGGHAWGMAIDLSACIGCGACVVACQAENNVPIVGKSEVMRGRAMHWLRVDRYDIGDTETPQTAFQPVPCMHCENAPCEVVCPVGATVHDGEGLNAMVYNRCVGTRFCSNNCPYKVRRFNFFDYAGHERRPPEARNPDVTVRGRGVMEKCTYCVQRVRAAHIAAGREDRAIRDGEVVTACQAACPTRAIVFGDLNDPASEVSRRKADPRNYALLEELNTRPRTTYATRLRNPNDALPET